MMMAKKWGGFQALEPSFSKSGGLEPSGLIEVYAYGRTSLWVSYLSRNAIMFTSHSRVRLPSLLFSDELRSVSHHHDNWWAFLLRVVALKWPRGFDVRFACH